MDGFGRFRAGASGRWRLAVTRPPRVRAHPCRGAARPGATHSDAATRTRGHSGSCWRRRWCSGVGAGHGAANGHGTRSGRGRRNAQQQHGEEGRGAGEGWCQARSAALLCSAGQRRERGENKRGRESTSKARETPHGDKIRQGRWIEWPRRRRVNPTTIGHGDCERRSSGGAFRRFGKFLRGERDIQPTTTYTMLKYSLRRNSQQKNMN